MLFITPQSLECICLACASEQAVHLGGAKPSAGPVRWPNTLAHAHGPHLPSDCEEAAYDMSRLGLEAVQAPQHAF